MLNYMVQYYCITFSESPARLYDGHMMSVIIIIILVIYFVQRKIRKSAINRYNTIHSLYE